MSDIEGKVARVAETEVGPREINEASGTSDMDGKTARVAETEAGPREINEARRHGR